MEWEDDCFTQTQEVASNHRHWNHGRRTFLTTGLTKASKLFRTIFSNTDAHRFVLNVSSHEGVLQRLSFWVWLLSLNFMSSSCCRWYNFILCYNWIIFHLYIDHTVFTIILGWSENVATMNSATINTMEPASLWFIVLHLLGKCPVVGWLDQTAGYFWVLKASPQFSTVRMLIGILPTVHTCSPLSSSSPAFTIPSFGV